MDDELPDVIQQKLQAVRERFAGQLAGRLAEVRQLAEIFAEDPQRDILMDLQRRLHSLAGACGMFGFAELGRQARAVEIEAGERLVDPDALSGSAVEAFYGRVLAFADNDMALGDSVLDDAMQRLVAPGRVRSIDQPVRIHLVETDALVAAELSSALEQFGYVLRRFSTLADAEAAARTLAPDVLVMDLSLAVAEATPRAVTEHIPLIFVSAQGDFAARMRAATSGGDAFMIKPVDVPRLAECIEELVPTQPEPAPRVLVVDDEVLLTQHCRLVLEAAGMAVQTLNSAPALLEVLAEFRPEVILLDLNMPDYSGQELAKMIRQQPEWVGIAISYLSAESNLARQIEALAEDGDDFLTKPISATGGEGQPDRPAQTLGNQGATGTGMRPPGPQPGPAVVGGHGRSRSFQTGQRYLGPRCRRPGDQGAVAVAAPAPAHHRQHRPLRRRGIPGGDARLFRGARPVPARRHPPALFGDPVSPARRAFLLPVQRRPGLCGKRLRAVGPARRRRRGLVPGQARRP